MITREEFVKICTDAIHQTRAKVTPSNQLSGYFKYQQEIKWNSYLLHYMAIMEENINENGYSLAEQHAFIEHVGLGNCNEFAEHLGVEIIMRLQEKQADAQIRLVAAQEADHVYLHISLPLKDEKYQSLWEIDAWDPRIIDRSLRPNHTIKNEESLVYGANVAIKETFYASDPLIRFHNTFSHLIEKPIPGQQPNHTPKEDMPQKYELLFGDYPLEHSYKKRLLNQAGKIDYLQAKSIWQSATHINPKHCYFFDGSSKKRKRNEDTYQAARPR